MKLTTYNPDTLPSIKGSSKKPLIGFSTKAGTFRFNRKSVEAMGLKAGNNIFIHQDSENVSDWYLEVVKTGGFELRVKENLTPGGLMLQSIPLAKKIMESANCSALSGHLQVGPEPVKNGKQILWPLFTGKLL